VCTTNDCSIYPQIVPFAAYQVLSDPDARKKYDQFGEEGLKGGGGGGGGFHFRDASTIFEQFFGGSFGGGGGGAQFHFTMGGPGGGGGGFGGGGPFGGGFGFSGGEDCSTRFSIIDIQHRTWQATTTAKTTTTRA